MTADQPAVISTKSASHTAILNESHELEIEKDLKTQNGNLQEAAVVTPTLSKRANRGVNPKYSQGNYAALSGATIKRKN